MKSHYCKVEEDIVTFDGECNWCGEREMTTTQEALKMAYKAEETGNLQDLVDAVNMLVDVVEALEQQEQEPVAWTSKDFNGMSKDKKAMLEEYNESYLVPLYTHPAKQLSDDEIDKIYFKIYDTYSGEIDITFARAIEAKIRGE